MRYLDAPTLSPNEVEVFARQIIEARAHKVSLGTVANQTKANYPPLNAADHELIQKCIKRARITVEFPKRPRGTS